MNYGFWKQLKRPAAVLAPMSGYTDAAYRVIIARYGKPDVMFTEFVPADGLCSAGRDNLAHYLRKSEAEHPIVAQLFGGNPDSFRKAAEYIASLGFAGIDINMGCPAREVERRIGGAALIKDPPRAREIIEATLAGAGQVPVSVKTRLGYETNELEAWLAWIIESQPAAITLHARTRQDGTGVPAKWEELARAVELAKGIAPDESRRPLIIGNGDVDSVQAGLEQAAQTGCDGVMVGRGVIGNPWFFNPTQRRQEKTLEQVLAVLIEHTELYLKFYGEQVRLDRMRKHFKAYIAGFPRVSGLRKKLMKVTSLSELRAAVAEATQGESGQRKLPGSMAKASAC